jgi:transposase-like protein
MANRRYTEEFRASAVVMLQADGYPQDEFAVGRVAKHLKVPPSTLRGWANGTRAKISREMRDIKKDQIIALLKTEIVDAIQEMVRARPDADYRTLATALGIMIDKMQLLSGEPTEHIQQSDGLTDDERAARIAAIFDAARTRRTG